MVDQSVWGDPRGQKAPVIRFQANPIAESKVRSILRLIFKSVTIFRGVFSREVDFVELNENFPKTKIPV